MNLFDILKSTCDQIKAGFPESPIHIIQLPQGFKRPAFSVNLIGFHDKDLCKNGLQRKVALDIVYFAPQDAKGIANPVQLYTEFQKLLEIFRHQSLQVSDRYVKITGVDGGPRESEIYLTVRLEYTFTPGTETETECELMQKLSTAYK